MGLPELSFEYRAAAKTVASRSKKGIVAQIVRDAGLEPGVYPVVYSADIPAELGADNQASVKRTLVGYVNTPSKVIVTVIGVDDAPADALPSLRGQEYDYIVGPLDMTAEEAQALAAAVVKLRQGNYIGKAVLPNVAADDVGVVNFTADEITTAGEVFETVEYCDRVAGILAGSPLEGSATGAALDEVLSCAAHTDEELDAAIAAGELVLYDDGRKIRLGTAVNSKATLSEGESRIIKKIKAVECIDLIHYYAIATAEDNYRGQCANTYDNKMLLVAALKEFLSGLEDEDVLDAGSSGAEIDLDATRAYLKAEGVDVTAMTDAEILQSPTGENVFISLYGYILDAMENFKIVLTIKNT